MFKPFEIYCKEKQHEHSNVSTSSGNGNGNGNSNTIRADLKTEWSKLSKKETVVYIKKAELEYDAKNELKPGKLAPFSHYLNKHELELLFEDYGLPEKVPSNSKFYYLNNSKNEVIESHHDQIDLNELIEKSKKDAEEKWQSLSQHERNKLLLEYYEALKTYNEKYFLFARNLPEQRIVDYQVLANPGLKNIKNLRKDKNDVDKNVSDRVKYDFKQLMPFELYYEKHHDEYAQFSSLFIAKTKARTKFSTLSEKKKLKFIKKAEAKFDSYPFDELKENEPKPILSMVLSRQELKILLESYGMPKQISSNLSGYYLKLHINDYKEDRMRNVFSKYNTLTDADKATLAEQYTTELEEYKKRRDEFLMNLPEKRLPDYEFYQTKLSSTKKSSKSKPRVENETSNNETEKDTDLSDNETISTKSSKLNNHKIQPSSTPSPTPQPTTSKVSNEKTNNNKIDSFVELNSKFHENAFSAYLANSLKTSLHSKQSLNESKSILNKAALKWQHLDEDQKEPYENEFLEQKKQLKKNIKKFLKEDSFPDLDLKSVKSKINEFIEENYRRIQFKFNDESEESFYLKEKQLDLFLDSKLTEIDVVETDKKSKGSNNHNKRKNDSSNDELNADLIKKKNSKNLN